MSESVVKIKVFGVGGGGNNAVNRMADMGIENVTLVAVNTDKPVLDVSKAEDKIVIGEATTKGRGAGANPLVGKMAAEESVESIKRALEGVDMLYITAGMGGGTGTGAAPVIARIAHEMEILTVAVVTRPFAFEGKPRAAVAEDGIEQLRPFVDALIVVSNEKLREISDTPISMKNAFAEADNVLVGSVKSICNVIYKTSFINTDFADVTTVLKDAGDAHIGIGSAIGAGKWEFAAKQALSSPLLDTSIVGANAIIINITADEEVPLDEITKLSEMITSQVPDAKVIWGMDFDPKLKDQVQVVVIATKSAKGGLGADTGIDGSADNNGSKTDGNGGDDAAKQGEESAEERTSNDESKREEPKKTSGDWLFTDEEFEKIRTVANHNDR